MTTARVRFLNGKLSIAGDFAEVETDSEIEYGNCNGELPTHFIIHPGGSWRPGPFDRVTMFLPASDPGQPKIAMSDYWKSRAETAEARIKELKTA